MPKKRKSNSRRSPKHRPLLRKQGEHPSTARTQAPARPPSNNGMSQLPALAHAERPRKAAPLPERRPASPPAAPGATSDDVPSHSAPALYGVGATYWLDGDEPGARSAVHFFGTGLDGDNREQRFERRISVPDLPSGVGRASLTVAVRGIPAGRWHIRAQAVDGLGKPVGGPQYEDLETKLWPFVRGPGVRPFAWTTLVLLGVLLAIGVQGLLVSAEGLDPTAAGLSALAASLVGFLSAKVGFMVLHRVPPSQFATAGTMIQAFLLGAFGALVGFAWLLDLPVLRLLDLTTPGVFAAMALGRPGCWLGGCCAGRPTASRWGLWSSDRRIGVRRVPVQLIESALAATIAVGSLVLVLAGDQRPHGLVLALSASIYTLARQLLFPLRAQARRTTRGRVVTIAGASVATLASLALLL